jgi:hypothetical protein
MPREYHAQAPFKRRVAGSIMLEKTMGDDPCTGIFFLLPRLAPTPCCQRRHRPMGTPWGTRMWCPRSISASSCTMARHLWVIGIRRAVTSDRSRGRPGSITMRAGHGGISRRVTTRGISGSATRITAITSSGPATIIAATSTTASGARAGPIARPATIVITAGPGTGTTAADGNAFSRRGRTACRPAPIRPARVPILKAERTVMPLIYSGRCCFPEPAALCTAAGSGLRQTRGGRSCALSASSGRVACLYAVPSAARAEGAQGPPAPRDLPRARAAPDRARRRGSWLWARPWARACYPETRSALA